jgi:hypothetical protein
MELPLARLVNETLAVATIPDDNHRRRLRRDAALVHGTLCGNRMKTRSYRERQRNAR